jgi:hypothetical protein
MEGLKTVTRGGAAIRDGVNRVTRAQQATGDATQCGPPPGFCGTARSFIVPAGPRCNRRYTQIHALAKQLTTRLDSLTVTLPSCEKTAGHDPATVSASLTTRLKNYDDALLAFRTAQTALYKPDSTKTVSQQ